MARTLDAIDRELGTGPFHYRYGGVESDEDCFPACTFRMAEARALLGQRERATAVLDAGTAALSHGVGIYGEVADL